MVFIYLLIKTIGDKYYESDVTGVDIEKIIDINYVMS